MFAPLLAWPGNEPTDRFAVDEFFEGSSERASDVDDRSYRDRGRE